MCTQALVESHRLMLTFLSENSSLIITKDISLPQMDRHVTEDNILMSNFDPNNSFDSILEIFLYLRRFCSFLPSVLSIIPAPPPLPSLQGGCHHRGRGAWGHIAT